MKALLQLDMIDASLAHRGSYSRDHDTLSNEPPAPVPFRALEQGLGNQVGCGCDRSTMYLWRSPAAARAAIAAGNSGKTFTVSLLRPKEGWHDWKVVGEAGRQAEAIAAILNVNARTSDASTTKRRQGGRQLDS